MQINTQALEIRNTSTTKTESPTVTLTWHACKYKVHKLHHYWSYIYDLILYLCIMYYTVCYLPGIFYAVVRQISMLFIDNRISVFCIPEVHHRGSSRMYLRWSFCTLYLHACQVRVTVGNSSLCCCSCVTYFER